MHSAEASALEKVRRAETHLVELTALVASYRDSRPYRVLVDPPGDNGIPLPNGHRLLVWYERPPLIIGAVAGDALVNLRAALDHLVWGLANPETRGTWTQFPIQQRETKQGRKRFLKALAGVSREAVNALERMQPYHGPGEPQDRPLAILNDLVNEDKHRNLIGARLVVPARAWFGEFDVEHVEDLQPLGTAIAELVEDAATDWGLALTDPDTNTWELQVNVTRPTFEVVTNTTPQRDLIDTLHRVRVTVIQAVTVLRNYLPNDERVAPDVPTLTGSRSGAA